MSSRLIPLGSSCAMLMRSSQSLPRQSSRNLKPTCMHHQKWWFDINMKSNKKHRPVRFPETSRPLKGETNTAFRSVFMSLWVRSVVWVCTKSRRKFASRIFRCVFHEDLCQDLKSEWLRLQYHCSKKCLSRLYLSLKMTLTLYWPVIRILRILTVSLFS